jgi:hypothetical protein
MESRQQMIEQKNFLLSANKPNVQEAIDVIISTENGECDLSHFELTSKDLNYLFNLAELQDIISRLKKLNLLNNKIKILPPEIGSLHNLEHLDISQNRIRELHPTMRNLKKLTLLDASENQIEELQSWIGSLENLNHLNVSSNQIKILLPSIYLLKNLKLLNISGNQIEKLSFKIKNLENLTSLNISANQIENLPHKIKDLQSLIELNSNDNPLTRETRDFLRDNPHLHAIYNMAAFDTIRDWNDVLNDTLLKGDEEVVKIIQDSEGLQKFLSRSGIDSKERKDALDYLLEKIKNQSTREETAALMIAATGDCSTPIHDCLAKAYFERCKERGIAMDENIIAKMAINTYLEKKITTRLKKPSNNIESLSKDKIILESGESIEQKHALLNGVLLDGSENNDFNKLKIDDKPYLLRSDTDNIQFSYTVLSEEAAVQCAKLFCQTDENGNLLKNPNNGHYIADKAKYDNVIENFKANFLEDKAEAKQIYDELIILIINKDKDPKDYGLDGEKDQCVNVIRSALNEMRSQTPPIQNIPPKECADFLYNKYSNVSSQKGQQNTEEDLKSSHDRPMQEKGNRMLQQVAEMINPQQQQNRNLRNITPVETLEQGTVGISSGNKRQRLYNHDSPQTMEYQAQHNNQFAVNQSTSEQIAGRLHPVHNQSQMQQQYATYNQNQQQYSNQYNEQFAVNQSTSQQMSQSSFSQREIQQRMQEELNERYGNPDSAAKTLGYDRQF